MSLASSLKFCSYWPTSIFTFSVPLLPHGHSDSHRVVIAWDTLILTDKQLVASKVDIVVKEKNTKMTLLIEESFPNDYFVNHVEKEKTFQQQEMQ